MNKQPIAYFCAEYGLDSRLPIYAGGLGVLAGDTLKAAVDAVQPLVALGLLYRGKQSIQALDESGWQQDLDADFNPQEVGLEPVLIGKQKLEFSLNLGSEQIWLQVWQKKLSDQVSLYLLDTNHLQNTKDQQNINDALYFGDPVKQFYQQIILGMGGARLLQLLGIKPLVYHLNEGRAAFLVWELLRQLKDYQFDSSNAGQNLTLEQAEQIIRQNLVYTNHTLVPAGNYLVPRSLVQAVAQPIAKIWEVKVERLLEPGFLNGQQENDQFSPTQLAMHYSNQHSGVSQLHTELSKQIWPDKNWVSITNGVHLSTWQDQRFAKANLSNDQLWQIHLDNKSQLESYVHARTGYHYDSSRLVIGWARRLAGYKRLDAVFADIDRLANIVKDKDQPVQLLIAGKAHQEDEVGKKMLQQVIEYLSDKLSGYGLFVPNFDLDLAQKMVRGCDLWLNIPERGKEACGTSGMKAVSNGVLQCTTLDGWTDEVAWQGKGWALSSADISQNFYQTLDSQIKPLFYQQDKTNWIKMMRASMELAQDFSAKRMFEQYQQLLYR